MVTGRFSGTGLWVFAFELTLVATHPTIDKVKRPSIKLAVFTCFSVKYRLRISPKIKAIAKPITPYPSTIAPPANPAFLGTRNRAVIKPRNKPEVEHNKTKRADRILDFAISEV